MKLNFSKKKKEQKNDSASSNTSTGISLRKLKFFPVSLKSVLQIKILSSVAQISVAN
jgi:hypothetical protein